MLQLVALTDRGYGHAIFGFNSVIGLANVLTNETFELPAPMPAQMSIGRHYQHLGIRLVFPQPCSHTQRLEGLAHADFIRQ
ncbi:hypothetical protein D3C81_2026110 [compost metagenome]